jgi:hypothetical protein
MQLRPVFLTILPSLIVAALFIWPASRMAAHEGPAAASGPADGTHVGTWGTLEVTSLIISPPLDMIPDDWGGAADKAQPWFFPATSRDSVQEFLASTGLEPDQVSTLMASAREEASIKGIALAPRADFLFGLPPDIRTRLYVQLAGSDLNVNQAGPFRFAGESIDSWLPPSLVSPATRRIVDPLIYRHGRHLYFADRELVRSRITDREELRRLAKGLLRQTTARLRLSVAGATDVERVAAYWGRGGRRTDIQPLLESLAGAAKDRAIDIVHLLPAFARANLYRYPRVTAEDLNRPELTNCLWTSLNFFNDPPDDKYLDPRVAIERLQRDYYLVHNNFELGDIVALLDGKGRIFHVAVYLADDFVFTKNGYSSLAPWVILPLDTLLDYYRLSVDKPKLLYHRRKDFS